ncbi:MAG TPA: hypothetical protein VJT75_18400 [Thermoleophilaceae bacterium]|nr:hypothetical protein [Thermoleophilaceae bacterium]
MARGAIAAAIACACALVAAGPAAAGPIDDGVREQSCKSLAASTVGQPEQAGSEGPASLPVTWPAAPYGLLPARVYLRTRTETFNRYYAFAVRRGQIYAQVPGQEWRRMPLPPCFDGRVKSIAADDDEMIALDSARRIYTMDNAAKPGVLFSWSSRWGTPFWLGPGYALPRDAISAWSWSVVSPIEDGNWTDPAGNRHAIGNGKVSHIWALRRSGRRIGFWDPWLPLDESYGVCGPLRGRFRAVNLSASGSALFVIGPRGDMFTRVYDFDLSGHDDLFFDYSYEDQRGRGDGAPIQLPAAPWVRQPKIPGPITRSISIHKVGRDLLHRTLRVRGAGGYWEKDFTRGGRWAFHAAKLPGAARRLPNPRRDTSRLDLPPLHELRYRAGRIEVRRFSVHCSPARLRVGGPHPFALKLHIVDGLRQQPRSAALDGVPREYYGDVEVSKRLLGRAFVRQRLGGRRHTKVTLQATHGELRIQELGLTLKRVK